MPTTPSSTMYLPSFIEKAIARIVELSAELQIKRHRIAKGSVAFHDCSVEIAAYGKVLEALTALQRQEEYSAGMDILASLQSLQGARAAA